jgi:arylsulfatase A-like enzyme
LQTSSELKTQPKFEKKYENSLWLEDQAFDVLIKSFREHRDPKKLWVLTSNDHGEVENPTRTIPRIASFYEDTLAAPVMTRFPSGGGIVYENCRKGFEQNRHVLAQNIDLLPTILDVVGFKDSAEHSALFSQLRGSSLCHPIDPNRIVVALNTNNIRQWNPEGFLLAKNLNRLVFTNTEGMQFFDLSADPKQEQNRLNEMPLDLRNEFRSVIEKNPQLLRIKNLYLKDGF